MRKAVLLLVLLVILVSGVFGQAITKKTWQSLSVETRAWVLFGMLNGMDFSMQALVEKESDDFLYIYSYFVLLNDLDLPKVARYVDEYYSALSSGNEGDLPAAFKWAINKAYKEYLSP